MSSMKLGLRGRREEARKNPIEPPVRPPENTEQAQEEEQHEQSQPYQRHEVPQKPQMPMRDEIDRMQRQPPRQPPMKNFLFMVNDTGESDKVIVRAPDIMLALIKFSQRYHEECADWMNIALYVEEVETVE